MLANISRLKHVRCLHTPNSAILLFDDPHLAKCVRKWFRNRFRDICEYLFGTNSISRMNQRQMGSMYPSFLRKNRSPETLKFLKPLEYR
jgi:hypothetical protein